MKKKSDRQQTSDDWTELVVKSNKQRKLYTPLGNERQLRFVRLLAEYLVAEQVRKSIELQMQKPSAVEWAALRNATPLFGYPTVDEAEEELTRFLKGL